MKRKCTFLLPLFLLIQLTYGQEEKAPGNKWEDLDFLAGSWNVNVVTRLSANGPWESSTAKSSISRTLGSKLLEEDFTGTRMGKPFLIKKLWALNNLEQKFQLTFADSEHGTLVDYAGERKGNQFIFDRTWVYPNKSIVKLRMLYTLISADTFSVESMRRPQNSDQWDTTGKMLYTKDK